MYYFKIELLLPKYKLRNSAYLSIKADWKEWSVYEPKKKKEKMNLNSFSEVESYFVSIGYCWIGEFVK